jgi:hypothetical protein
MRWGYGLVLLGRKDASFTSLDLFRQILRGDEAKSGITVTTQRSLEVATVLACCKVIAEGIAQVPWRLYREQNGSASLRRTTRFPNSSAASRTAGRPRLSSARRSPSMQSSAAILYASSAASAGRARSASLSRSSRAASRSRRSGDILAYDVRADDGSTETFRRKPSGICAGRPGTAGWAWRPSRLAREAIGLAIATEEAHATFHKNGAKVSGLFDERAVSRRRSSSSCRPHGSTVIRSAATAKTSR